MKTIPSVPVHSETLRIKPSKTALSFVFLFAFAALICLSAIATYGSDAAVSFDEGDLKYTVTGTSTVAVSGHNLTSEKGVDIPSSVTYSSTEYTVTAINNNAFWYCASLKSVSIPASVTSIGASAFQGCGALTSVTIGSGVESIGTNAFYSCSLLPSLDLPASVKSIGRNAFGTGAESALQSINVDGTNTYFCSENGVLFNKDKTMIVQYPAGKTAKSYTIPSSVKTIGIYAFYYCSNLTSMSIPNSVETIDERAFASCVNLASVTLGNGVTSIGLYAFSTCSKLVSMKIPASVTTIGESLFSLCYSLKSITVDGANTYFCSENGVLFNKDKTTLVACPPGKSGEYTVPDTVKNIGNGGFYSCNLNKVVLPDGLESIGDYGFYQCCSLTSLTLGSGTPSIVTKNYPSFSGCYSLVEICNNSDLILVPEDSDFGQIAKNAVNIYSSSSGASILKEQSIGSGAKAIYYETGDKAVLVKIVDYGTSVVLPDSLGTKTAIEIRDYAFYRLSFESISIPDSVASIGKYAFQNCSSLKSVKCLGTTPADAGMSIFGTSPSSLKIMVPAANVNDYKGAENWSSYQDKIVGFVEIPTANTGLVADGTEQVGIDPNPDTDPSPYYEITGDYKGTDAGRYTATATLNDGYVWPDGTDDPKNIKWTLAGKSKPTIWTTLTLTASPEEGGKVTGEGKYLSGELADIKAVANPGYRFVSWSDGDTNSERTVWMNFSMRLTAEFEKDQIHVSGVSLDAKDLSLAVGDGRTLTATVQPSSVSDKTVRWSSSDDTIVSVDQNGNIKALISGQANIIVTTNDGGYTAVCAVTVSDVSAGSDSTMLYAAIGVIILIAVLGLVVFLRKKQGE